MALKLYINAIQVVLRVNAAQPDAWAYIYGSLSCLRQSLLCCSCRKLLAIPHRPASVKCGHNYCKRCITHRKPPCKYCVGNPKFEENVQLRIVLQCYKRMCKYILVSGIFRCWDDYNLSSPMLRFISMVYEGGTQEDSYHYSSTETNGPSKKRPRSDDDDDGNSQSVNGRRALYSIKLNDTKLPKVMIKKTSLEDYMLENYIDSDDSSDDSIVCPKIIEECMKSVKRRKSCRCGMATRSPGKLTCYGQRCPCYVGGRACINCRCRGCQNPLKRWIPSPDPKRNRLHRLKNHSSENALSSESYRNMNRDTSDETSDSESDKDSSDIKCM